MEQKTKTSNKHFNIVNIRLLLKLTQNGGIMYLAKRVLVCLVLISVSIVNAKVVCNKFEIITSQKNEDLYISLDTDLPNNTEINVSISRSYIEANGKEYSVDYYSSKSTVLYWKQQHKIDISNRTWEKIFNKTKKDLAQAGLWKGYKTINNKIDISFIVPIYQKNPAFGNSNKNLEGKYVTTEYGIKSIDIETSIIKKIDLNNSPQYVSYNKLQIGEIYLVSRKTPVMPLDKSIQSLSRAFSILPGSTFGVIGIEYQKQNIWYTVLVKTNGKIIKGKINSIALMGQDIKQK